MYFTATSLVWDSWCKTCNLFDFFLLHHVMGFVNTRYTHQRTLERYKLTFVSGLLILPMTHRSRRFDSLRHSMTLDVSSPYVGVQNKQSTHKGDFSLQRHLADKPRTDHSFVVKNREWKENAWTWRHKTHVFHIRRHRGSQLWAVCSVLTQI